MTTTNERGNYQKAVRRLVLNGIQALDDAFYGQDVNWTTRLDLDTLDIDDAEHCVLGQVYARNADGYDTGYDYAREIVPEIDVHAHGFLVSYDLITHYFGNIDNIQGDTKIRVASRILTETWVRELRKITTNAVN